MVGRPPPSKDGILGRSICVDPIEAVSTVAIPWVTTCERTHEVCRRSKQPPLPTRVLNVGNPGEDVVLVDSRGLEGPYVILSYCWGQGATLKTTPSTLAARQLRIPHEDLPLTLRHAVDVTRQLQVKYLWIDALCIIQEQNPPTDWLAESGKMLDYYRNAYVTIGNLDGEASSSGFLFPRKDTLLEIPGNQDIAFRLNPPRRSDSIYFDSVLVTRAWCLQERLISTRLLLFGRDQIFWECRTCCESESEVVVSERKLKYTGAIQGKQVEALDSEMVQVLASLGTGHMPLRDSMNIWYTIVQQYSSRRLTVASDILIAISGVANDIQRRTGYDYMYGHWKQDWCKGLVWSRRPRPDAKVTGAPSWSWASQTGKVVFKVIPTSEDNIFNTVLEDQIEFRETRYDEGELHVRAKCQQIDARRIFSRSATESEKQPGSNIYVTNRESSKGELIRNTMELDESHDDLPRTTYKAMNTLLRRSYTVETDIDSELLLSGHFVVFYLVLVPEESSTGKWKRIGMGSCIQEITPRRISFEDLDCENIFQKLHLYPELLFDGCDYEDICLI
ncbi:heterokaryon incompatibility protein [Rutstroemia sp. NJR-2017a BVV2]|nr:heterokaryon incompatibility protein [Rutstroemia sp. NJR-2017a BVV2]